MHSAQRAICRWAALAGSTLEEHSKPAGSLKSWPPVAYDRKGEMRELAKQPVPAATFFAHYYETLLVGV